MTRRTGRCRRRVCRAALAFIVLPCLLATPVESQQRPERRAQLEQRTRERFAELVQTRLEISDEKAELLRQVLENYRQDRLVLFAETRALRVKIRNAVRASGDGPLDDDEGAGYLAELRELSQREGELAAAEQDALGEILSPGELVVFYVLRDQMTERIRQLRTRTGNNPGPD